jgi:hypothetical protein
LYLVRSTQSRTKQQLTGTSPRDSAETLGSADENIRPGQLPGEGKTLHGGLTFQLDVALSSSS